MGQRGRRPLTLGHIRNLNGSERAKERMTTLLSSLHADCTIPEACRQLGLSESHFHELRHGWLQASLEALEPRLPGRRARILHPAEQRVAELEQEVQELRRTLALAQARCEVLEVTAAAAATSKKGARFS